MHSHHSHSGQYVQHAKDSLEEVIQEAIRCKLSTFCLTEHMPRIDSAHIYPEEIESNTTVESLAKVFDDFYHHAKRLQKETKEVKLLVGTEVEYIDNRYYPLIKQLREDYKFDMIVGSIHHVETIPIDYDLDKWIQARDLAGGAIKMFENYFDSQYTMLQEVKPDVVGHFDLIKLLAKHEHCGFDVSHLSKLPSVWSKVERNIDYAIENELMFEINSAAIRKGWDSPYPSPEVAQLIVSKGGQFCMSDDSHGTAQVALNYHKAIAYLEGLGVERVYYLDIDTESYTEVSKKSITIEELKLYNGPVKST